MIATPLEASELLSLSYYDCVHDTIREIKVGIALEGIGVFV